MSLWGLLINKGLKTIKAVVRVLNESIVRFSGLQELIEDLNSDEARGYDHEKPLTKIKIDDEI